MYGTGTCTEVLMGPSFYCRGYGLPDPSLSLNSAPFARTMGTSEDRSKGDQNYILVGTATLDQCVMVKMDPLMH